MSGTRGSDRAVFLAARLGELYPPPLRVVRGRGRSGQVVARYLNVPSPASVRLLVPSGRPRATARAIGRQLTGQRPRTRVARAVLQAASRSGLLDLVPGLSTAVVGPPDADSIETVLTRVLSRDDWALAMPVGPARANRKSVLQVSGQDGELAYVKVGHDELTSRLVRQEAAALERLAAARLPTLAVPRLLACTPWRELVLLVMSPVPVDGVRLTGVNAREGLRTATEEIADSHDGVAAGAGEHRALLRSRLRVHGTRARPLLDVVDDLEREDVPLRTAAWHGDLNPGNVALTVDGTSVWDWERYGVGVPRGFDLLHHDLAHALTVRGEDPLRAARGLIGSAAQVLRLPGREAVATARSYLVELGARYLDDRQDDAGAPLGVIESWLVPALAGAGERPRTSSTGGPT